jgi:hypothetical protein
MKASVTRWSNEVRPASHIYLATLIASVLFSLEARAIDTADTKAFPFPAGEHAALTKQVCAECHEASIVVRKRYDKASAQRYYKLMTGDDPASENGQRVIQYLTTVLGRP